MNKKICYYCKYGGKEHTFKINTLTHLHCCHPDYEKQHKEGNTPSPWETLREWWDSCKKYEETSNK